LKSVGLHLSGSLCAGGGLLWNRVLRPTFAIWQSKGWDSVVGEVGEILIADTQRAAKSISQVIERQ
jgi:hypothetical protein